MDSKNIEKSLKISKIRNNIVISVVCVITLVFLIWIYYKWQSIPVRKHYFDAELITSIEDLKTLHAQFMLLDYKTLDINKEFYDDWSNSRFKKNDSYCTSNNMQNDRIRYIENCVFTNCSGEKTSHPYRKILPSYYDKRFLIECIGEPLFNKINYICDTSKMDISLFTELFFYRHLDNENSIERKKRINHGIEFKKQNGCSFFYTLDKNEFFLGDYSREKNIGINTFGFEKEGINKHTLSRSINGFKNVTQSYLLSAFSNCITIASTTEMIIPSRRTRFLNYMTKLEDISQSYYFIKLRSNTIPELSLHMEFYGTIECNEDKNSKNVLQIKKDRSSVDISRMNSSSDCDFIAHIKFNDMQNMQTSRLFIIGVLVSLTITELIRQLYRIAKNISTIRNKDKKSDIDSKLTEIIPDVNAQESEDLPNFYL